MTGWGFLHFRGVAKSPQIGLFDPGIGSGRLRRLARHPDAFGAILANRRIGDLRPFFGGIRCVTHQDAACRVVPYGAKIMTKTDGRRHLRRTLEVVYRTGAGLIREEFSRASLGAALMRAEFVERVENVPVYLKYPESNRLIRCVS